MAKAHPLQSLRSASTRPLTADDLKALYYIHDRVAQTLTEILSAEPSSAATWQVISVEQQPFHHVLRKYPRDSVWSLLGFGESLVGGVALVIEKESVIAMVRQAGAEIAPESENEITEFELGQIDNRIQQFSEAFSTVWGEFHPLSLQLATFPNTPTIDEFRNLLMGIQPETPSIVLTFQVTMIAREVQRAALIFPQPYLAPLYHVLKAVNDGMLEEGDFEQVQNRIAMVDDITTPVAVQLGSTRMSFSDIQNMEFNDFIVLDQSIDKPLTVKVGKDTVMKGMPGTTPDGRYLAVQIVE
ncbi:MAG: FliM/FliN family flagellar motor switch protein [Candidatus Sericytochromatia bacterium]|nr:FliM/FliN family flagellar motor switch protein [Candidatus Sericytochromatia bacterium]